MQENMKANSTQTLMKNKLTRCAKAALLMCSLVALNACTSMSTMQDARTTEKGKFKNTIGIGTLSAKVTGGSGVAGDLGTTVSLPMIEWMGRYGFTEDFDAGLRTSIWAHGIDAKYRLIKGDFSLALGLGVQQMSYEVKTTVGSTTTTSKYTSTDLIIPIYLNYAFSETFTGYLVPKSISRTITATGSSSTTATFTGASLGLSFGKEGGFFIEQTSLSTKDPSTNETLSVSQTSIGFKF